MSHVFLPARVICDSSNRRHKKSTVALTSPKWNTEYSKQKTTFVIYINLMVYLCGENVKNTSSLTERVHELLTLVYLFEFQWSTHNTQWCRKKFFMDSLGSRNWKNLEMTSWERRFTALGIAVGINICWNYYFTWLEDVNHPPGCNLNVTY